MTSRHDESPRLADRGGMEAPIATAHPRASMAFARQGMVLVVDDEPAARELLHRPIAGGGLGALVAWSTAEALVLARRYPIAVLVTGVRLRSMTGIELAAQVRELHPGVPVILVTEDLEAGVVAIEPPAAILAKPFSPRDFTDAVAAFRCGHADPPAAGAERWSLEDGADPAGRPDDRRSRRPGVEDVPSFTT